MNDEISDGMDIKARTHNFFAIPVSSLIKSVRKRHAIGKESRDTFSRIN
jgi:hypothetical protein